VVLNLICKQVQKLTGASEVPPTQPLSSFGIDSMMGTELSVYNWLFFFGDLFSLFLQIWIKDKFNVQISAMRLMSAETCETITQKIVNNKGSPSSSTSSSPAALLSTFSREDYTLPGFETEFVGSKKINSQFHEEMNTRHAFPAAPEDTPISRINDESAGMHTFLHSLFYIYLKNRKCKHAKSWPHFKE
jgi:hypothetical protein